MAATFNTNAIGVWGEPVDFPVDRDRIKAYAAATNDPIEPHAAGELAPPVFAIVPAFQAAAVATVAVVPAEHVGGILHGEQDFRFHAPIRPGTTVRTRCAPVGVHDHSSGVTVCVRGETHDVATGRLLVEQYLTSFVRGAHTEVCAGEPAPPHTVPAGETVATVEQTVDADQTYRYSQAAGDPMPIHLDDEFARSMGLPGIIVHGLCTMAFTSVAVIRHACPDDPTRLRRLAVRFAGIVRPGQTITTRLWDGGPGGYGFETTADDGTVAIRNGLAEIGG